VVKATPSGADNEVNEVGFLYGNDIYIIFN
jgi:hypothetical protein